MTVALVISCHLNSVERCAVRIVFVRSGHVNPANTAGTFRNAGNIGYEWSSRTSPTSATLAYWFEFTATESRPSYGPNNRYNGLPLRCLLYAAVGADLFILFSLYMSNTALRQRRGKPL